ncbi:MAG: hypothetical protein K9L88_01430 [Chromatiaceae bacterium]|nr:hypothetical protein [Chromatiaceae bacterium]
MARLHPTPILALAALTAACLLWAIAAAHGWYLGREQPLGLDDTDLAATRTDTADSEQPEEFEPLPAPPALQWRGADALRAWARQLMDPQIDQDRTAAAVLNAALQARPLHAPSWLDLAEVLHRGGNLPEAERAADAATALWPGRPQLLQDAAWLKVEWGASESAVDALMAYWIVAPQDSLRTLAMARRLTDTETLLKRAADRYNEVDRPLRYQAALLDLAQRANDLELGSALWQQIDPIGHTSEALLFRYLQLLIRNGQISEADAVWQDTLGDPPGVTNGGFETELTPLGRKFRPGWATPGWRYRPNGKGYRIRRDTDNARTGEASLRIAFAGSDNVNLTEPGQVIRVRPGVRYRLTGWWSGEDITTRSGIYIEMYTPDTRPRASVRTAARRGVWDWEPIELDIQIPENALRLVLRIRRNTTNALDRRIGGTLWLDDLQLTPVP